ncbi:DUF6090 family protein [Spongiimicrobium salis]|uniref:DUF6090 family protein n=1 Tax=Spongiimicrobium salis TaxID=1667022 RepID=UPI00374DE6F5
MIKFFRKIRQKALTENKFSKYLLYATGEIVLVVIGILIALAINNNNETRKTKEVARAYLNSLNEEFEFNLALLDKTIATAKELSQGAVNMRQFFNPQVLDTVSEREIGLAFKDLNSEAVYSPSNGVLSEIISSGNLKILENEVLKQHLASFEKRVERMQVQEQEVLKLRNEMSVFVRKNGNVAPLVFVNISKNIGENFEGIQTNKKVFESTYFLNTIIFYGLVQEAAVYSYYFPLRGEIVEIISLIHQEIEKQKEATS